MERVIMKYVNKNKEYCLLIGNDDEELYVVNLDSISIYKLTPMGSLFDVLEEIDFEEDNILVNKDEFDGLKYFLKENADEIDSKLMLNILENMVKDN